MGYVLILTYPILQDIGLPRYTLPVSELQWKLQCTTYIPKIF